MTAAAIRITMAIPQVTHLISFHQRLRTGSGIHAIVRRVRAPLLHGSLCYWPSSRHHPNAVMQASRPGPRRSRADRSKPTSGASGRYEVGGRHRRFNRGEVQIRDRHAALHLARDAPTFGVHEVEVAGSPSWIPNSDQPYPADITVAASRSSSSSSPSAATRVTSTPNGQGPEPCPPQTIRPPRATTTGKPWWDLDQETDPLG
jgi:hypothetical protein